MQKWYTYNNTNTGLLPCEKDWKVYITPHGNIFKLVVSIFDWYLLNWAKFIYHETNTFDVSNLSTDHYGWILVFDFLSFADTQTHTLHIFYSDFQVFLWQWKKRWNLPTRSSSLKIEKLLIYHCKYFVKIFGFTYKLVLSAKSLTISSYDSFNYRVVAVMKEN